MPVKRFAIWTAPLAIMTVLIVAIVAGRHREEGPQHATADGRTTMTPDASPEERTEAEWRRRLTPEQVRVLREKGTERAFTGKYWNTTTPGTYKCAGCGLPLFSSDAKFDAGCGWPSFFKPLAGARLTETIDKTLGMTRIEITCRRCGGHLGHVFRDGPEPTGLRYCINSVSLQLETGTEDETDK